MTLSRRQDVVLNLPKEAKESNSNPKALMLIHS